MSAILDSSRKRDFTIGGFGWEIFLGENYHQRTHLKAKSFVNIFVQLPFHYTTSLLRLNFNCNKPDMSIGQPNLKLIVDLEMTFDLEMTCL